MLTTAQDVKKYYDKNTQHFLKFGEDAGTMSIHQPLWKSRDLQQAINHSNELILIELIEYVQKYNKTTINVLDLGCGVGSSLFYLAAHPDLKINLYGVSISSTQIEIAQKRTQTLQLANTCQFIESDFHNLSAQIPVIDIAFSIEAFAHAKDADLFFQQVSNKLSRNGKLILIDDFLCDSIAVPSLSLKQKNEIQQFKYGWMLDSLLPIKEIRTTCLKNSLVFTKEKDLTSLLKINRIRDRFIRLYVKIAKGLFKNKDYFKSLIGGDSRQYCLEKGLIKYKMVVFEKV